MPYKEDDILKFNTWVAEAQWAAREWRSDSWRDCEMYDGGKAQWTESEWDAAIDAGIDPLTINRIFPTINFIRGSQAINKFDMTAKGRTQKDSETGQVMSEGLKFVMDQANGDFLVSEAFRDQLVPGIGYLIPALRSDPRKERVGVKYADWKEVWWDPFANPWLSTDDCRYVFQQRWMDVSELKRMFPNRSREIDNIYDELRGDTYDDYASLLLDEANIVEEEKRMLSGSHWANHERQRVRPVEMWYTVNQKAIYALYADGRALEINESMDIMEQYNAIQYAQEVIPAVVKKVRVCQFLKDLKLVDQPSPYPHDMFPIVPFLGYIDRWGFPYGVGRQIQGEQVEINKRRSMALALLKSRRVIVEEGVAGGDDEKLDALYEEANKLDGFMVIKDNKLDRIQINENAALAQPQIELSRISEAEIQQITGANEEVMGHQPGQVSGKALERLEFQRATATATLFDNLRRSQGILGEQLLANMQGFWKYEKVLRITDRLTGAERFVSLNEPVQTPTGEIEFKNNITQGKYDLIVSEAPQTDTIREKNLELIIEWVKKSPPEVIPHLMQLAFEMSDLPNKEQLLAKIKPILGADPNEEDMSPEEMKAKVTKQLEAHQAEQQKQQRISEAATALELEGKRLENEKLEAEIQKILAEAGKKIDEAELDQGKLELESFKTGAEIGMKSLPEKTQQGDQQ